MRRALALLTGTWLLCWIPFTFATELLASMPSLHMRGSPAVIELGVHAAVAMLCATAGWMLWTRAPAGFAAAVAGIVSVAAIRIQSLFWTALPRNHAPGDRLPLAAVAAAAAVFWLALVSAARPAVTPAEEPPVRRSSGRSCR
jgi:hypothetical protein